MYKNVPFALQTYLHMFGEFLYLSNIWKPDYICKWCNQGIRNLWLIDQYVCNDCDQALIRKRERSEWQSHSKWSRAPFLARPLFELWLKVQIPSSMHIETNCHLMTFAGTSAASQKFVLWLLLEVHKLRKLEIVPIYNSHSTSRNVP